MEVEGECEEEIECPYCKKKFIWTFTYVNEIDLSDYAPDRDWYD